MRDQPLPDDRRLHFAQLECQCRRDMLLLPRRLADVEQPCLTIMVCEALCPQTAFRPLFYIGKGNKPPLRRFAWTFAERVGLVVYVADRIAHGHMAVLLKM